MTEAQKAKLETLRAKTTADLSDPEKAELDLLSTIEKQDRQITEKDSLIGAKGTEIDTLKKSIEGKTGAEKKTIEEQLASKEEALETMKLGLDALKEAHKITAAATISPTPGHGDTVDPKEVEALETKAYSDPKVREEVEKQIAEMEEEDWNAFNSDPHFKKLFLEKALGTGGDKTKRSPWGDGVKKNEGTPAEGAKERMARLFDEEQGNHRRLPPNSSGRGGRGRGNLPAMPKAAERETDNRAQ